MIMKKIFTLLTMCVMALAVNADITIYVKADVAPYIWAWNASGNVFTDAWPGTHQLTEKKTVKGTEFWYYTFGSDVVTPIGILFNNGAAPGTVQSADFNGIAEDRYFTLDASFHCTDVTEDYGGVIPDADITSVTLAGAFNGWNTTATPFTEVTKNAKYICEWDLSAVSDFNFKIVVNGSNWLGYWDFGDTQERLIAPVGWINEGKDSGNMLFDLANMDGVTKVLFTATWVVGKDAGKNWTLTVEGVTAGIAPVVAPVDVNAPCYDLSGRRVDNNFRGVVIQNGKKVLVK